MCPYIVDLTIWLSDSCLILVQNYRNEDAETDEMGPHTMRKRALKSRRKKKEKGSKADPKCESNNRSIRTESLSNCDILNARV